MKEIPKGSHDSTSVTPRTPHGRALRGLSLTSTPGAKSAGRTDFPVPPSPPPQASGPQRAAASGDADTDESIARSMSLPHVGKVTTPYGFRAVLRVEPLLPSGGNLSSITNSKLQPSR
ncbi:unnamed protein product [Boreogadus saida]